MPQVDTDPVTVKAADSAVSARQDGRVGVSRTVSLGGGVVVPYPEPLDDSASKVGRANRRAGTKPEVRIRAELHRRGLRFRKDLVVRAGAVSVRPDIVFTPCKVTVFVDGCFWHQCPEHFNEPKRNQAYWVPKIQANVERDRRVGDALSACGWTVLRVWEHEEVDNAVDGIANEVERKRDGSP